jgi:glycosyl transferase family 25
MNNTNNTIEIPNKIEDFKNVFYINLENRIDRKENVEKEINNIGIKYFQRFNAIKKKNGAIGCSMSHIKLLQNANKDNLPYIMICEDDIQFTNPELFVNQINGLLSSNEKWDVILLAGNNVPPYTIVNDFCVKVTKCQTTTGYIVKKNYYDTLINNMKEGILKLMKDPSQRFLYAIDKYWFELQKRDIWLLITPLTVTQRADYSDIEKKVTNYSKIMMDLDKTYLFIQ